MRHAVASQSGTLAADVLADIATAKATANDAFRFCAQEAIQLHGGVGFTWEYDPQLYFKRAQACSAQFGTTAQLLSFIAQQVIDRGEPCFDAARAADAYATARKLSSQECSDEKRNATADACVCEVADWMRTHLIGEFACLQYRGGPGDEEAYPALRKKWERELASGGWTGLGWPAEQGGRGLSVAEQVIFHEEYARAGGPGRMGHIGEGLLGPTLIACGTDDQRKRFLPGILNGTQFWCQGYSEPGAGSDLANVRTRAVRDENGNWRVHGQKVWTSLAHDSDWIFVIARTDPESRGNRGLSFLLMPLDATRHRDSSDQAIEWRRGIQRSVLRRRARGR